MLEAPPRAADRPHAEDHDPEHCGVPNCVACNDRRRAGGAGAGDGGNGDEGTAGQPKKRPRRGGTGKAHKAQQLNADNGLIQQLGLEGLLGGDEAAAAAMRALFAFVEDATMADTDAGLQRRGAGAGAAAGLLSARHAAAGGMGSAFLSPRVLASTLAAVQGGGPVQGGGSVHAGPAQNAGGGGSGTAVFSPRALATALAAVQGAAGGGGAGTFASPRAPGLSPARHPACAAGAARPNMPWQQSNPAQEPQPSQQQPPALPMQPVAHTGHIEMSNAGQGRKIQRTAADGPARTGPQQALNTHQQDPALLSPRNGGGGGGGARHTGRDPASNGGRPTTGRENTGLVTPPFSPLLLHGSAGGFLPMSPLFHIWSPARGAPTPAGAPGRAGAALQPAPGDGNGGVAGVHPFAASGPEGVTKRAQKCDPTGSETETDPDIPAPGRDVPGQGTPNSGQRQKRAAVEVISPRAQRGAILKSPREIAHTSNVGALGGGGGGGAGLQRAAAGAADLRAQAAPRGDPTGAIAVVARGAATAAGKPTAALAAPALNLTRTALTMHAVPAPQAPGQGVLYQQVPNVGLNLAMGVAQWPFVPGALQVVERSTASKQQGQLKALDLSLR